MGFLGLQVHDLFLFTFYKASQLFGCISDCTGGSAGSIFFPVIEEANPKQQVSGFNCERTE